MIELTKGTALKFSELPEKAQNSLSFESNALKKGKFQLITFAKFDPIKDAKEPWYGVVLLDTASQKQYQTSFNTLLGTAIRGSDGDWVIERLPETKQGFKDAADLKNAVEKQSVIKITSFHELEVQIFGKDKTKMKAFPVFTLV